MDVGLLVVVRPGMADDAVVVTVVGLLADVELAVDVGLEVDVGVTVVRGRAVDVVR